MKKKTVAAALLILAVSIGALLLRKPGAADHGAPVAVRERYVSAEGKIEIRPGFEVEVGSELEGKIAEFPLKEGEWVKKGDVIAVMTNTDIRAALTEAEAALSVAESRLKEIKAGARAEEIRAAAAVLEAARADLEFEQACLIRYRALYEKSAISRQLLDEKEMRSKNARARVAKAAEDKLLLEKGPRLETIKLNEDLVAQAAAVVEYRKSLLEKTIITAPISGKIIRKYLEGGEFALKEKPLAAIADTNRIWVNAEVDETDIGAIQVGDSAQVRTDAFAGKFFPGKIEEIADYAGPRKVRPSNQAKNFDMKVVQVKIGLNEPTTLKPRMTVEVRIEPK